MSEPEPYSDEVLIDLIVMLHGPLDDIIEKALFDDICPGACTQCGTVHDDLLPEDTEEYCDSCGADGVESVCVLAGVL